MPSATPASSSIAMESLAYIFAGESEHAYGVFGGPSWCRNWSAVSGACFAIRRAVFDQVGGFSENPRYPRLDIDLCLRVTVQHGWRIFYNSYAQFPQGAHTRLEQWVRERNPTPPATMRASVFPWATLSSIPGSNAAREESLLDFGDDNATSSASTTLPKPAPWRRVSISPRHARAVAQGGHQPGHAQTRTGVTGSCRNSPILFMAGSIPSCAPPTIFSGRTRFTPPFSLPAPDVGHPVHHPGRLPCPGRRVRLGRVHRLLAVTLARRRVMPRSRLSGPLLTRFCSCRMRGGSSTSCRITNRRFYPAGSISAMVEATYHFGFTAICNTVSLRDIYTEARRPGGVLRSLYRPGYLPRQNPRAAEPQRAPDSVLLRPPDACAKQFRAVERGVADRQEDAGQQCPHRDRRSRMARRGHFGLEGIVHNLGLLPYSATGALYRSCTAGVALMMTCHPSYLPFELMASGALVITNSNPYNSWLLKDRENCLLAENSPTALADALEEGLTNQTLREKLVDQRRPPNSGEIHQLGRPIRKRSTGICWRMCDRL